MRGSWKDAVHHAAGRIDRHSLLGLVARTVYDRYLREAGAQRVVVEVTTLDEYVERTGVDPDWLLIDIEGFEIRALEGARRLLQRKPTVNLVVEMHPNVWDSANTTRDRAERLLAELELEVSALSGQTDPLGDYGHVHLIGSPTGVTRRNA